MIEPNELTIIMAERLKELRGGLSHDKVSKAIEERYGVKISKDSLMNYEFTKPNHDKTGKNKGMRIEYLWCLADFYGVSADYILGLTDIKIPDTTMRATVEYTGLTEDNVGTLHTAKDAADCAEHFEYNSGLTIHGDRPYLDFANDLLDALYENRETLTSMYYLLRREISQLNEFDFDYNANLDQEALNHGCSLIPTSVAVRYYCARIGGVIERYLAKKYIDGATTSA